MVPYFKRKRDLYCSVIGYVSRLFGALLLSIIKSGNFLFTMCNFLLLATRTATNRCLSQISSIVDQITHDKVRFYHVVSYTSYAFHVGTRLFVSCGVLCDEDMGIMEKMRCDQRIMAWLQQIVRDQRSVVPWSARGYTWFWNGFIDKLTDWWT